MSQVIIDPSALSLIQDAAAGLSVGHKGAAVRPFGGRMSEQDIRALVSPDVPREGLSVGQSDMRGGEGLHGILRMLGATSCRMWGEPVPGNCCDRNGEIDPCKARNKVCGAIVNYSVAVSPTAAEATYELRPNNWFLPLFWQDASSAETYVASITYQGKSFQAAPDADVYPAATYPLSIHNPIFGYPACSNTKPITFDLRADIYDGSRFFRGKFIGISVENY